MRSGRLSRFRDVDEGVAARVAVTGCHGVSRGLLSLFSLRGLLGMPEGMRGNEKVVVTMVGQIPVGVVVDRMRAIIPAERTRVEPIPAVLAARIGGESRVKAIYRGEAGHLVSILEPETLFREEVMQRLDLQSRDPRRDLGSDAGAYQTRLGRGGAIPRLPPG